MIDLTKYLFYKATDRNYGKKEFDFSVFDPKNLKSLDNIYGGSSNLDGVVGQVYDFLLSKGIPPVGAAAILGNIQGESSFNSAAVNPSSGASGLCQWTDDRFADLKKLANSKGVSWTDVDVQLEYLAYEFDNKPRFSSVREVIMNAEQEDDLEYATWYWGRYFEVYFIDDNFETSKNLTECTKRYKYAQTYYAKYLQNKSSSE